MSLLGLLSLTACDASSGSGTAEKQSPPSVYASRCARCHGVDGSGRGPASAALRPPPPDFRDAGWHGSITDEAMRRVIVMGGLAVGKSALMPAAADLADRGEVLAELVRTIRGFNQARGSASPQASASVSGVTPVSPISNSPDR